MAKKKYKKVVVGGTFDILHKGHEVFLKKAFELGETTIGLTSDEMAEKIKGREVRNFRSRKKELEKFIKRGLNGKYKIVKIEDKFGPTIKEDFDYIVVSPLTYKTALLINKKRQKIKKKPIKIIKIKFVLAEDRKPISATQIIKGQMNKQGKLIKNRFANKERKIIWTQHSKMKLKQYRFSEKRVLRIFRKPDRIEEGIAEGTIAAMQITGTKRCPTEAWMMYLIMKRPKGIKVISAWRYPGRTAKGERPIIPEDTLKELGLI